MRLNTLFKKAATERQGVPLPRASDDPMVQINFKLPASLKTALESVAAEIRALGGPRVSLSFALRQGLQQFTAELLAQLKKAKAGKLHGKQRDLV